MTVDKTRRDERVRKIEAGESSWRLAVDHGCAPHATNAALLPPDGISIETGNERQYAAAAEHTSFCTPGMPFHGQGAFQRGFHMLISPEREYLDGMLTDVQFTGRWLETK